MLTLAHHNPSGARRGLLRICTMLLCCLAPLAAQAAADNINTVAGTGTGGFSGDGTAATAAQLNGPGNTALDSAGNIYIADSDNHRIRKVTLATGVITTVAGKGTFGFSGDGGLATAAELKLPYGVALDSVGNIYIADYFNRRIRKVTVATGVITTVAGTGSAGSNGDGGLAAAADLYSPRSVALDSAGNIYIADISSHRIRKITAATGLISTVAGTSYGFSGDGGAATAAQLNSPAGVTVDSAGNIYIADSGNKRLRKVAVTTGVITTVAGTGTSGSSGDGGLATAAQLSNLYGVALDSAGNIYIADFGNDRIRKVTAATGLISTVAGTGISGFSGDGAAATAAKLSNPMGVTVDSANNIYIADYNNQRIRKLTEAAAPVVVAPDPTPAIPLLSVTINGVGPGTLPSILNMGAGDGPSFLSQVIGLLSNTLGMPLSLVEQNANGTVTLRGFNGDNLNFVPFSFQSVDARANGIYPIGYGQYQVVFNGRSISMAPVLTRLDQLIALFPGMTVAMAETGALTASLNGTTYVVQPGLAVQLGQATGAARLVLGADGLYRFTDAQGNTQVLYPAFVAPAILRRALQAIDPAATMTIELDATATTVVDGIRYALVPDLTLGGLRTEDLGKYFWTDGLNRYRMWVNIGVSQGTAFKPK